MSNVILDDKIVQYKFRIDELLKELQQFTFDIQIKDLQELISSLKTNINEPFLFVVIGEVKSGKSSFINSLLNETICKVDAAPCTDVIQKIIYSDSKSEIDLKKDYRQVGLPLEILKTIAIVDTPGTNTIIKNHQEITQKFIPNSDIVFFVFLSKNPHTQSSWEMLDYISEDWRKKVVFVLHQADVAKPEELSVNLEKLREYAIKRDIENPRIFVTSSEWENAGDERSGFAEVRDFIRETVIGGRHYQLKLVSILDSTERAVTKISESLELRKKRFDADKEIVERAKSRLNVGKEQSNYEVRGLIDRLVGNYDRIADEVKIEFREGLSVFTLFKKSINSLFRKDRSIGEWIRDLQQRFEGRLNSTFEEIASDGAKQFLEGVRHLLRNLLEDLVRIKNIPMRDEELFRKIGERRNEVIDDVRQRVAQLLNNDAFANSLKDSPESMAPTIFGSSILALLGTIILTVTNGAFFDITGGLLTGIGVLLASGIIIFKRGKIIHKFEKGLDEGKKKFRADLTEKLNAKLRSVYDDINMSFVEFYEYVSNEENKLLPMMDRFTTINSEFEELATTIKSNFKV
ncbi:dynamin family protein [candidate division KSB1 bacterium]|nr:dynamin family protein [candidate division KSB1 bacterium]